MVKTCSRGDKEQVSAKQGAEDEFIASADGHKASQECDLQKRTCGGDGRDEFYVIGSRRHPL